MSHTLFTADNISVKGYHYTVDTVESLMGSKCTSWPEKTWDRSWPKLYDGVWSWLEKYKDEIIEEHCIHLDFTLLINWKLKTFGWSFIVVFGGDNECWQFEDWTTWNAIYFTLKSLGYKIEDSEYLFWQEQAQTWIGEIMQGI
jgi:hypothetical protein